MISGELFSDKDIFVHFDENSENRQYKSFIQPEG